MRLGRPGFRQLVVVVALASGSVAAAAIAGAAPSAAEKPVRGGTLRILSVEPAGSLEPTTSFADSARLPLAMMFETLIERDAKGSYVPALAERFEIENGGATYVFTLRKGLEFSDGSPITAADVKFSIDRMRTQGFTLKSALSLVASVTTRDPRTIQVNLKSPSRIPLNALSRPGQAVILPRKAVRANKNFFTTLKPASGPWQLVRWTPKKEMILAVNPLYYKPPYISQVKYLFGLDNTAAAAALVSGAVDMANVGYADASSLREGGKVNVFQTDSLSPLFFGFDKTKAPFNDVRVRQAFAYAMDRVGKQQACWYGTGAVNFGGLLRPWDPNYAKINTYRLPRPAALKKAGELLDAAGWVLSDGKRVAKGVAGVRDGTALEVTVPYESNWPQAECHTLILQSSMRDVGVRIIPQSYDWTVFWTDAGAGKFAMWHGGAGAVNGEDLFLNWFRSGGPLTGVTTQLNDKNIDRLVDTALSTTNLKQSGKIIRFLDRWQAANQPMLSDGYQWIQVGLSKRVRGYVPPLDIDSRALANAWIVTN